MSVVLPDGEEADGGPAGACRQRHGVGLYLRARGAGVSADPATDVDTCYWRRCLDDAERAESEWRRRGRIITQIYRNDVAKSTKKDAKGRITFNILYANTEVMLPAIYSQPPEPIVRSRWAAPEPPPPPMPMPMMLAGGSPVVANSER